MIEIKVPSPGESISEVQISRWIKNEGDYVEKDEEIAEIDSDKATLTIAAEADGILHILAKEGETIAVGSVVCTIDTEAKKPEGSSQQPTASKEKTENNQQQSANSKQETSPTYASGIPSPSAEKNNEGKKYFS